VRQEIPKAYEPHEVEKKWYPLWEQRGYFRADVNSTAPRYSIVLPPPNVTGSLHMGHALNITLHDVLVRWKRMSGFDVLWRPGTDHAGIATQNVVERRLAAQKLHRTDLGREKFEATVWEWKEQAENNILTQIRRLGCSCDWSRKRFTLDEGLSRAVREVFVKLYEDGLIYHGSYLVNWCPRKSTTSRRSRSFGTCVIRSSMLPNMWWLLRRVPKPCSVIPLLRFTLMTSVTGTCTAVRSRYP
jgi:valyl-tRNA synthetase